MGEKPFKRVIYVARLGYPQVLEEMTPAVITFHGDGTLTADGHDTGGAMPEMDQRSLNFIPALGRSLRSGGLDGYFALSSTTGSPQLPRITFRLQQIRV